MAHTRHLTPSSGSAAPSADRPTLAADPARQAFLVLRAAFTVAPILFGADKFADLMVNWDRYLAPWIAGISPLGVHQTMYVVGGVEILAGIIVALAPRLGAPVVALWLAGIVVNLLTIPGYYDIALRDFGLFLAAIALWRLAVVYDRRALPWSHGDA
ncbi:MAG TPA: hypothetical protein VF049_15665 [Nocardioidaceae bacterium]|jgi:hypothetical protein